MFKMFVVGLGGSGGKTLQFLMEELRNDLHGKGWTKEHLPACWEFIHIDVPAESDGIGPDLPPTVPQQGGEYIGVMGVGPASYKPLDDGVVTSLPNLDGLVGWRPDPPNLVAVPIASGAGQYRAVGRMLTLSRTGEIFTRLQSYAKRFNSQRAEQDLDELTQLLNFQPNPGSMVLVVSSLAGGTGASMTMDVCNLLRNIEGVPGNESIAFLYAPDVFGGLPAPLRGGVNANALGTIAEILSAQQAKTKAWTDEEWQVYRTGTGKVPAPGRGPQAVFAVGASTGNGVAPFGSKANDIYRGLARTLVPLLMSEQMPVDLRAYTITNWDVAAGSILDRSPLAWDPDQKVGQLLGAIGSATISLGRDRYAEYAAQRIARSCVERLLRGHQNDAVRRQIQTDKAAMESILPQEYLNFRRAAGLPEADPAATTIDGLRNWVVELLPVQDIVNFTESASNQWAGRIFGGAREMSGQEIAQRFNDNVMPICQSLKSAAETAANAAGPRWVPQIQSRIERATLRLTGRRGLPLVQLILRQLRSDLLTAADNLQRWSGQLPQPYLLAEQATVSFVREGSKMQPNHPKFRGAVSQIGRGLTDIVAQCTASVLSELLREAAARVVVPLRETLSAVADELSRIEREATVMQGVASVRTDNISQWPMGDHIAPRWSTATSEVLLEPAADYPTRFSRHIASTFDNTLMATGLRPNDEESADLAAEEVITFFDADPAKTDIESADRLDAYDAATNSPIRLGRRDTWWPQFYAGRQAPKNASYEPALDPSALLGGARKWVQRATWPLAAFIRQGIREALLEPAVARTAGGQAQFVEKFTSIFFQALKLAAPLAAVDQSMVSAVHDKPNVQITYQFSEMPLGGMSGVIDRISGQLKSDQTIDDIASVAAFVKSAGTQVDRPSIEIQGLFEQPYSPLAYKSLMQPVQGQWNHNISVPGLRQEFWKWRRTRPLSEFLPVTDGWIQTFLTGWLVGRMTGEVVVPGALEARQVVRTWVPPALGVPGRWAEFGPHLLGVIGINNDVKGWSIPAKILESLALAMAMCNGDPMLRPLIPFVAVRRLGERYPQTGEDGDNIAVNPALVTWLAEGRSRPGADSQVLPALERSGDRLVDAQARLAQAKAWTASVQASFKAYDGRHARLGNWAQIEPFWEITSFLTAGAANLGSALDNADLMEMVSREFSVVDPSMESDSTAAAPSSDDDEPLPDITVLG